MHEQLAVSVNKVSKKFRLFNSASERFFEALHPFNKSYHREFWAIRDVSFDVPKGSTVGIVGRNGSGKSTLLQIISSVTSATVGSVSVNGRIAALLELGAGFNPERTGRENVFFKGALMGFDRAEMKERLPIIEEFAGIGDFIDQPVKTYSSGMFIRLAFATAINVDPDLLIVDEALAVGDVRFQHKCFNKFIEFQRAGKTILFVSHAPEMVVKHCDYAILLEGGRLIEKGEPKAIAGYYMDLLFTGKISGHASKAVLVEEGYKGFNIVHYGMKHYGLRQSAGRIDFETAADERLRELEAAGSCAAGSSSDEVKGLIDRMTGGAECPSGQASHAVERGNEASAPRPAGRTELDAFIEEPPSADRCVNRRSYNGNEHRFGDRRAEISDYLAVCKGAYDPLEVTSGDSVDLYFKIRFNEAVERPMVGFSIKSIDGITVYGSNTRFSRTHIEPVEKGSCLIVRYSIRFNLIPGDFFIELGVAEKLAAEDMPCDIRKSLIHLTIRERNVFEGFAELETSFEEVSRKGVCAEYCAR